VVVFTMDSDNSYTELGPQFTKYAWWSVVIGDYMKDVETSLRTSSSIRSFRSTLIPFF